MCVATVHSDRSYYTVTKRNSYDATELCWEQDVGGGAWYKGFAAISVVRVVPTQ